MREPLLRTWRWVVRQFASHWLYLGVYVDDLPDDLLPKYVYLVGVPKNPWQAAFLCPCGCRATINLSLIEGDCPSWKANLSLSGKVTLRPSVNRIRGCRAHFFLRAGRIQWAGKEVPFTK